MRISLAAAFLLASSALATHSSNTNSHARRSLDLSKRQAGLGPLLNDLGLPLLGDTGGDGGSSTTSSTTDTSSATSTSASSTATDSSSASGSAGSSAASASSAATDSSSAADPSVTPPPTSSASDTTSVLPPTSVSDTSAASSSDSGTSSASTTDSSASSTITDPPTSAATSGTDASSSTDCGLLGLGCIANSVTSVVLGGASSILSSAASDLSSIVSSATSDILPPTSTPVSGSSTPTDSPTSAPTDTPTSAPPDSVSSTPTDTPTVTPTSTPTDPPTSTPTSASSDGGFLSSVLSGASSVLSSILDPPPPTSVSDTPSSTPVSPTSAPPSSTPDGSPTTDVPPSSVPPTSVPPSSTPDSGITTSVPITTPPPSSVPTSVPPTITFPGGNNATTVVSQTSLADSATSTPDGAVTTLTSFSVDPALSFVLTESSLAVASVPTTTSVGTLTDPDQVTSSFVALSASEAATTIVVAPLPTGIPGRILPADAMPSGTDLSGFTLISILFNQELNWPFVVTSPISSSQIFAYVPVLIQAALGVSGSDIKTFALQVYVPTSYQTPADSASLGTMWLGYIPTDLVDQLAAEIKAKQSAFYTGVSDSVARNLANRVNSGFSLLSVSSSAGTGTNAGTPDGSLTGATGNGDNSKSRQDAIIGVVSALGAIAVLVLVFLVYRSMKRRQQLAHHRLSDPPDAAAVAAGLRTEGLEFDQDSVGGARRRSFYFAEDSLRGFQGERNEEMVQYDQRTSVIGQRRNVVPAAISAPILQQSSMNW